MTSGGKYARKSVVLMEERERRENRKNYRCIELPIHFPALQGWPKYPFVLHAFFKPLSKKYLKLCDEVLHAP